MEVRPWSKLHTFQSTLCMLSADHLNINGLPFPVKYVRKFRSALGGAVTYRCVCACARANAASIDSTPNNHFLWTKTDLSVCIRLFGRPNPVILSVNVATFPPPPQQWNQASSEKVNSRCLMERGSEIIGPIFHKLYHLLRMNYPQPPREYKPWMRANAAIPPSCSPIHSIEVYGKFMGVFFSIFSYYLMKYGVNKKIKIVLHKVSFWADLFS